MRRLLFVALLAGCGETLTAAPARESVPDPEPVTERAPEPEAPAAEPLDAIRARSGCAFESPEALCEAFREHYLSSGTRWVSDGCALGEPRTTSGAFAEARTIAIRVGHDQVDADTPRVERALLGGTVREPPGRDATTQVVLAARIGVAWFPLYIFHPAMEGETVAGERLDWSLDETGASVTWTFERGSGDADSFGGGETERTVAVAHRGVPMIAAQATIERWSRQLDLDCARACNRSPSPPPPPECSRRCASTVRETRSWEREGDLVRIGATEVQREGVTDPADEVYREEAATRRLDVEDHWLDFCAFMPVVRAVPAALPQDAEATAARERARAMIRRGRFRELAGARAAAEPDAPRATIEIDEAGSTACGGGGCTTMVRFRTIEGSMPERGVHYFAYERGPQVGCDAATLPRGEGSTIVEVAPATSGAQLGCGFSGYDGEARRSWVIVRVLEQAP